MDPRRASESSLSLAGVGSVVRGAGGGPLGFEERWNRFDTDEPGRGCPYELDKDDPGRDGGPQRLDMDVPARGGGRLPPGMLMPPIDPCMARGGGGPRSRETTGGGVMARRVTGSAYGMTNALESGS